MPILQSCFEEHPTLSYLYPLFHMVMRSCYQQAEKPADANLLQAAKLLSEEVGSLETLYAQVRDYLNEVIIDPSKQGLQLPSSAVAEIYHSYCLYASKQDFQSDALSAMETKDTFLPDIHTQTDAHSNAQNWLEYLNHTTDCMPASAEGNSLLTHHSWIS